LWRILEEEGFWQLFRAMKDNGELTWCASWKSCVFRRNLWRFGKD